MSAGEAVSDELLVAARSNYAASVMSPPGWLCGRSHLVDLIGEPTDAGAQ
jgi:hypothetical protein